MEADDIKSLETTDEGMLKAELGEVNVHRDDQIPLDEIDPKNIPQDKEILPIAIDILILSFTYTSVYRQPSQVFNHLVTFDAHTNSIVGLQATSTITGPGQFASFSKDNSVKLWSVTT